MKQGQDISTEFCLVFDLEFRTITARFNDSISLSDLYFLKKKFENIHLCRKKLFFSSTSNSRSNRFNMGGKTSRVTYDQWDLMALAQAIGISEADIHKYYQDFNKAAGKDGKISKSEFASFYKKFPGSQHQSSRDLKEQTARIFRTFDRDNSSSLSFEEFLGVIVMMNHDMPRKDRFDYLIRNNNPNGCQNNGQITADYGQEVFQSLDNSYW